MALDPIAQFHRWFSKTQRAGIPLPEAMALATATRNGRPSLRFVLLKHADDRGFVFFTDARSQKGRELRTNSRAAAVFYWNALGKQVRIEGRIEPVASADANAYWETRPRASRLAARTSHQSTTLRNKDALTSRWRELRRFYRGKRIPRPTYWMGFRIVPDAIEFWTHREHRLHDRELFVRTGRSWKRRLLQP